ncbi:MAG TPA: hypothetical protein VLE91_02865 [Candidatus Saccharimonadales bacterium]|nr:hypothetical protein [Candidatus Saccharimonadales bacterium]
MAEDLFQKTLTALIQNQIKTAGKDATLAKIQKIKGLQIKMDGSVEALTGNVDEVLKEVLEAFTDAGSKTTAEAVIQAKQVQAEELKQKVEIGWQEVSREKAQLTSALEFLPMAFITTDANLKVTYQNPATARVLGLNNQNGWNIEQIQEYLTNGYMIKVECEKCAKVGLALPPTDVDFKHKRLRIFISPIKTFTKTLDVTGFAILIEELK